MSATVTLTIPNKAKHIADRARLETKHRTYETSINELTITRRDLLTRQQQTAVALITLVDAVTTLENYRRDVGEFNQRRETTQNRIHINNGELQQLLDRITTEIAQAEAEKAVADATAAKTAADQAAALQDAKNALQEYITTLQTQLSSINENNINDITGQIQSSANTIRTLGAGYSDALLLDNAISQDTKGVITDFKKDTVNDANSYTSNSDILKREFDQAKSKVTDGLRARIQALEAVAGGANVTADQITDALGVDKKNPNQDNSLGEIKGRATDLAAKIAKKTSSDFGTRKDQIDQMIAVDMATFQEKQQITEEYQKIMNILDSDEFKAKEKTIQDNITNAHDAMDAAFDDKLSSMFDKSNKNLRFGIAITNLNTSISSLETELQASDLEKKLRYLQEKSAEIIDIAPIQARIDTLNAAKREYDRLNGIQQARAAELSAERKPVPPTGPRPTELPPRSNRLSLDDKEAADSTSAPIEPKRNPGRRYSIFIPTPTQQTKQTKSGSRVEAATAGTVDIAEDTIDPTVLEIFVYEDDKSAASVGEMGLSDKKGGSSRRRRRGQRGGAPPPKVAKIIKISEITPEIQNLFLSFKSPSDVLSPDFLKKIEEHASSKIIAIPQDIDNEMTKVKPDELIYSTDDTPFFENLGQKASHKTTIEKLMIFLDNSHVRGTQNGKTYREMYSRLWQFMEYSSGSISVLRSVFSDITDTSQLLSATQSGITKRRSDLTWLGPTKNELFNILFMELSKCYNSSGNDDGTYSLFLETQVSMKGQQKYRFMLNWTFLIAFHLYYARQSQPQNKSGPGYSVLLAEFIEHMYHTFIGWMESLDSTTLKNLFIPLSASSLNYKSGVKKLIDSDIKTDATLAPLIKDIQIFLCNNGEKGKREKPLSVKPTTRRVMPAKRGTPPPLAWSPAPPNEPYPGPSELDSESNSDSESESEIRPPASNSPLFRRVVVPPLKLPSSSSSSSSAAESKIQSARDSRDTKQIIPSFATSREHAVANETVDGGKLPTYPKPPLRPLSPTTAKGIRDMPFTRRLRTSPRKDETKVGVGGKRTTRKHHRSVPSSVLAPAPATRRHHRDNSSSSQKRTRRQRRASIRT